MPIIRTQTTSPPQGQNGQGEWKRRRWCRSAWQEKERTIDVKPQWRSHQTPLIGGGQHQQRPGMEGPWWGWRKEGTSDHHQCWSQFLVGFIHQVWWHPPDDGRLCVVVAEPEQVGTTSTTCRRRGRDHHSLLQRGAKSTSSKNKQFVEGTSNRAEPSSFSPNGGHICQDGGCGGHRLAMGDEGYKWEWGRQRLVNLFCKQLCQKSESCLCNFDSQ